MKFIVSSSSLLKQLQHISGVLNSNNSLPILDHFLFEINKNEIEVTASDLETTMVTKITVESKEEGIIASIDPDLYERATGLNYKANQSGLNPKDKVLSVDKEYFRPTEVDVLIGDPSKAKNKLGWKPNYDLVGLVGEMITADLELFKKDLAMKTDEHST